MRNRVAFLRAVNVGGTGKAPMADLRALAAELGLGAAATVLQSGSLVFGSDLPEAALETKLRTALEARFSLKTEVIVRSAEAWRKVIDANPYSEAARNDPSHMVVMPLKTEPAAGAIDALRSAIVGRETVALQGSDLYAVYPDGIGESKLLIGVIERKLGVKTTGRNWNTTLKIAALFDD